jgi:hypothetical protein
LLRPHAAASVPMARSRGKGVAATPDADARDVGRRSAEPAGLGRAEAHYAHESAREWKEEWTYPRAPGSGDCTFVNATLVDAVVDPEATQAATQVASSAERIRRVDALYAAANPTATGLLSGSPRRGDRDFAPFRPFAVGRCRSSSLRRAGSRARYPGDGKANRVDGSRGTALVG